jgi:ribonuclease PH
MMGNPVRPDGRSNDELREITFERSFTDATDGSVLVTFGRTKVLCTATVNERVPRWMVGKGVGWVTAEYSMLPGSSSERIRREAKAGKQKGRTLEIERLIGRALRSVVDMRALGEREVTIDCDVLQADGGTRTASICGGFVALYDALQAVVDRGDLEAHPVREACAAISVGLLEGEARLDLPYIEDANADVDMNVVMTESGGLVEVQGTAEGETYSRAQLDDLLDLAEGGIASIVAMQRSVLGLS